MGIEAEICLISDTPQTEKSLMTYKPQISKPLSKPPISTPDLSFRKVYSFALIDSHKNKVICYENHEINTNHIPSCLSEKVYNFCSQYNMSSNMKDYEIKGVYTSQESGLIAKFGLFKKEGKNVTTCRYLVCVYNSDFKSKRICSCCLM